MTRKIPLTKGMVALVDDADYLWLRRWKWCYSHGYAVRTLPNAVAEAEGYRSTTLPMQCALLKPSPPLTVDHINLDGLDNRRGNLRLATHAQQSMNCPRRSNNTSGYKGVTQDARNGKWHAEIRHQAKHFSLGYFSVREEAALAYNEAAERLFGEFARLNDVTEHPKAAETKA